MTGQIQMGVVRDDRVRSLQNVAICVENVFPHNTVVPEETFVGLAGLDNL